MTSPPGDDRKRQITRAREHAFRLLSRRSRTASEMRDRLRRKGVGGDIVEECVSQLLAETFLDDASFAREYVDYTREHKPMGRIRLHQELRKRGVDDGLITQVLADITREDEEVMARRVLQRRGGIPDMDLPTEERQRQVRRLFSYLARRGFSRSLIRRLLDPYA